MSGTWTFLTNHALVLLSISRNPGIRLRDIATAVGITERAAQRIVLELEGAGYLTRDRVGRRNIYAVHMHAPMRHPSQRHTEVGALLAILSDPAEPRPAPAELTPARS